jgi:hypothetical protein
MKQEQAIPFTRTASGDGFEATPAASGPWHEDHSHGGAPAALLAAVIEAEPSAAPMDLARMTMDLLGPVPIGTPLRTTARVLRDGARTQLIEAALFAGERCLATASAVRVRSVGREAPLEPVLAPPDPARHRPMPGGFAELFTIIPVRGAFNEPGPADGWFRCDAQLVEGIPSTGTQRAVAAADFGSGISHTVSFADWLFPTLDLTVAFARPPEGDWFLLQSSWIGEEAGRAICSTKLSDAHGMFGHALQAVLITPRRPPQ